MSSSSSSASRGERRKISGSMRSSEASSDSSSWTSATTSRPERAGALVELLEVVLVVVLLDDDQAGVGAGRARVLRRRVAAEEDRKVGRVADSVDRGHDREALGALLLGRSSAVGVADEGDDRDPVPFRDRLAERPSPGHCADPTCGYVPIGCQTVFSSRKAAISHGLWLGRRAVDDALDVLGRELLELGREAVGAGDVDRVDVHVGGEPRRELGALAGEDVDDAAGDVGGGEHLAELDGGERVVLGGDDDGRVAADDRGRDARDEALERRARRGRGCRRRRSAPGS